MQALRSFMTCNGRTLSLWERHFPVFQFHRYSAPRTRNTCGWCCWEATFHLLQPEERLHPGHAAQSWPASGAQGRQAGGLAAQEMTSLSPGGLRLAGWGWGGRCRSLTFHWGLGYRKPMNLHGRVKNNWPGLEATEGTCVPGSGRVLLTEGRWGTQFASVPPRAAALGRARGPPPECHPTPHKTWTRRGWAGRFHNGRRALSHASRKSSACRVYKARPSRLGPGCGTSSHRAPGQANQYHFPVLELGNYEGERLPDLSPALHYFADIKINCLILGKHMLRFKLSALVCSGIICIDLPASSQFCLLTSRIIRDGAVGERGAGMREKYEEE